MKKPRFKKAIMRSSLAFSGLTVATSFTSEPIEDNNSVAAPSETGVTGKLYKFN